MVHEIQKSTKSALLLLRNAPKLFNRASGELFNQTNSERYAETFTVRCSYNAENTKN